MASDMIKNFFTTILNPGGNYQECLNNKELEFHGPFSIEDSLNGLYIGGVYTPEEIILNVFVHLKPKDILNCSLVCKRWCNIAKSNNLWHIIYNIREYPKKAKNLPWYLFYCYFSTNNFKNLLKNGNGQEQYKHWNIVLNGGDQFVIEDPPAGCDPLPEGIPDFDGHTSCFVTSYHSCSKYQKIDLPSKRLLRYIIQKYKPTLYLSEWYSARFDCASAYLLAVRCDTKDKKWSPGNPRDHIRFNHIRNQPDTRETSTPFYLMAKKDEIPAGTTWKKMELTTSNYPIDNLDSLYFCHEGQDCQFWAGHYGSKMAGGVLKFVFESMEPSADDIDDMEEKIDLQSKSLLQCIIKKYKPTLYVSEWYCARVDCGSAYLLAVRCDTKDNKWYPRHPKDHIGFNRIRNKSGVKETTTPFYSKAKKDKIPAGTTWKKMELTTNNYPIDYLDSLYFCHEGRDRQIRAGHYGSKIAGGVLKFVFESMEPSADDIDDMKEVI